MRGRAPLYEEATEVVRLPLPLAVLARRLAEGTLRAGDLNAFFDVEARLQVRIPLSACEVAAGFPSPADDYLDRPLDFNELLIENPAATFAVRVSGLSMKNAGIFPGDIAIVNRAKAATHGAIVLALLDGEFTLKRYVERGGRVLLRAENRGFEDIVIGDDMAFEVWGVVSYAIRML
jgi:DNA polymerase V